MIPADLVIIAKDNPFQEFPHWLIISLFTEKGKPGVLRSPFQTEYFLQFYSDTSRILQC
jgi:hypothetical protein